MGQALSSTVRATLRPWPHEPTIRHLVLFDFQMTPTREQIDGWVRSAFTDPEAHTIRTGALFPPAAGAFESAGFRPADRLALLERPLPPTERPPRQPRRRSSTEVRLRRMRARDLEVAATLDAAAFPAGWRNDADSLQAIAQATPQHRSRLALVDRRPVGFATTGRAGPTGYIQRLAVDPATSRRGVGRRLVVDSIIWLARRGATNVLVNTGVDNEPALALYRSQGFRPRDDVLVVMELHR